MALVVQHTSVRAVRPLLRLYCIGSRWVRAVVALDARGVVNDRGR